MNRINTLLILCLFLFSCGGNPMEKADMPTNAQYSMAPEESSIEAEYNGHDTDPSNTNYPEQKKIIKDGRMGIRVDDLEGTKRRIDSLLIKYKGYYAKESFHNSSYESAFNLRIRVPGNNYEWFIADIESGKGNLLYKEIDARDVTEQFLDIETRLANKRAYLSRYQELVKQAKTIKEILEIEEQVRKLEEEIESAEGKLRYLNSQVTFSTLDLTISKENDYKYTPGRREHFMERLKEAVSGGWYAFVDFFLMLINIWPFWIIIVALVMALKHFRKKKKQRS